MLLLLFRHSAKSLNAQDERLATSSSPSAARGISEATRISNQPCYPQTGWCMSRSPSLLVGVCIQDKATDVTRSAPQGAHYHADVVYLLP